MRLIDLDRIKPMDFPSTEMDGLDAVRYLNTLPTIDAVPVVRCRECKHYKSNAGLVKSCFNDIWNQEFAVPTAPDDFCSYGERKEGAD